MSWLAGYFAADGCVTDDGHCSISSAYRGHLEFVREAAAVCGIGYGLIQENMRLGISGTRPATAETPLYKLSLRRRDLPDWFFLTTRHAQRAQTASLAPERDPFWIVESVRATGRTESVYCAITGEAGAFALADDLMTGNCDRQVVGKFAGEPVTNHVADPWPSIVGTAVHAWLAEHFSLENGLNGYDRWITEKRVSPHPLYPGTADLYDGVEELVCDWKGIFVSTPVATPDGWTTMGQLQPGDTVFGTDGRPCQVTRTYPAQYRDCYRITFDDGSELITDDVQEIPYEAAGKPQWPVMLLPTAHAADRVWSATARPQRQLRLRNGSALELAPRDLIVHPYVLGCWLGDGSVHSGTIGAGIKDAEDLSGQIRACGYTVSPPHGKRKSVRTIYGLSGQLRVTGLQWRDPAWPGSHGRLTGVKQVPPEYLRGSYEQRLALLQGLMDTDGNWNKPRKRAVFSTTSKHLAVSVAELAATLGWKAHIAPHQSTESGLPVTGYYVEFTPHGANPFRLQRKAAQVRAEGSARSRFRIVRNIKPVLSVPTRCIDVDSPDHLYLAGEQLIPVHNCLGPTSMAKVMSAAGPPRHYQVQLLLYAAGYRNLGFPVRRVVLAALPRTASSLDSMYLWTHDCGPGDDALIADVLDQTAFRREVARRVLAGQINIGNVPIAPGDDICYFCPFFRPESARDYNPGCPGHSPVQR
jgi:hypothetical protein